MQKTRRSDCVATRAAQRNSKWPCAIDTFHEENACFKVERVVLNTLAINPPTAPNFHACGAQRTTLRLRRLVSHRLRRSRSTTAKRCRMEGVAKGDPRAAKLLTLTAVHAPA